MYDDSEQVAKAAAELFVGIAEESIKKRSRFRVALSGGSTPRRVYGLLATTEFSNRVDWAQVDVFWGDERYVSSDSLDSNYRMTADALLQHIPLPAENVYRVPTEISPPAAVAAAYEMDIRNCFAAPDAMPEFDLIYLGLGVNGHTASLFPHSSALRERSRLVVVDFVAEVNNWRISMSAPLLNSGRTVAFLVEGKQKAQVLREVLIGERDPERLPAQLIVPKGNLVWLLDRAAAALVSRQIQTRPAGDSGSRERRSA